MSVALNRIACLYFGTDERMQASVNLARVLHGVLVVASYALAREPVA